MTLNQYFVELSGQWKELDSYQDFQLACPLDAAKFQKLIGKRMGL